MIENLYLKKSNIHGLGVFSKHPLLKGNTFSFYVKPFNKKLVGEDIINYTFPWNKNECCIVLGLASYLNHSKIPNCKIHSIDRDKLTKTFIILEDIQTDNEITISYGKNIKWW